jgi:hypothetical protein
LSNTTRQITSDIAGRLKKIRSGVVYTSITSVISELLQNCQRAKAENIFCEFHDNILVITDDGKGCKNPDDLFTLDKSVWESTDDGFGEGFTSVYTVADILEVYSQDWFISMDIASMIDSGNLNYQTEKSAEYLKGFRVKISGEKLRVNWGEIFNFLEYSASLLPMKVYVNGRKIPKIDMIDIPSETGLIRTFDNKLYTAYLTPSTWTHKVTTYYESREVASEYLFGVTGNIVFKKNAVNLKAPDRRAIIDDQKYKDFREQVKKDTKKLYNALIQEATNELIDKYAVPISEILEVKDYEDLLALNEDMFDMYAQDEEINDVEYEEKFEPLKILKPQLDMFCTDTTRNEENQEDSYQFPHDNAPTLEQVKALAPRAKKANILSVVKSDKLFWVEAKYLQSYKEAITNMEYYGFKGILAHNKVYEKLFKHYGVPHVSDLINNIRKQYAFTNIGAKTLKERRALFLLSIIEKHYNLPETFNIANLSMKIVGNVAGRELKTHQHIIGGVCDNKEKKIYLDRKLLKLADFSVKTWNTSHIGVEDIRFILRNADTICHELAHLLYRTRDNTLAHMEAQAQIAKEIGYLF